MSNRPHLPFRRGLLSRKSSRSLSTAVLNEYKNAAVDPTASIELLGKTSKEKHIAMKVGNIG